MTMFIAFGAAFEVPVAVVVLARLGVVSIEQLKAWRGYFIVGAFVVSAVITPPDVVSQLALAIPMCLLYEARHLGGEAVHQAHAGAGQRRPTTKRRRLRRIRGGTEFARRRALAPWAAAPQSACNCSAWSPRCTAMLASLRACSAATAASSCAVLATWLAGDRHHHVARAQAAAAGRPVLQHAGDQHALAHRQAQAGGQSRRSGRAARRRSSRA